MPEILKGNKSDFSTACQKTFTPKITTKTENVPCAVVDLSTEQEVEIYGEYFDELIVPGSINM